MGRIVFAAMVIGGLALSSICFGYSGGSGTPEEPYRIANKEDLLTLAETTEDYNKCFILTADIDMGGQVFTTAIIAADTSSSSGFQGTAFTGMFDGNDHKITNFTINGGSNDYLGLFGQINAGGSVKNLGLENFSVSGSSNSQDVGGLVGSNYGSISNCYSTGTVSGSSDSVGGLVAYNEGTISACYSTGSVTGDGYVGGLVGGNRCTITNCYSTGSITGDGCVGGLVAYNEGTISACYSTGSVSGTSDVGGLVGFNFGGIYTASFWDAQTSEQSTSAGGLVGGHDGTITDCYSTGAVSGTYYVGGLVGENFNDVGLNDYGTITNCYSTGAVTGSWCVGGLVGYKSGGSISSSYFLITSGPNNGYGTPLTDAQMKQQSSFVGWDFTNETANGTNDYWRMCVNGVNYPHLNWESMAGDFACPDGVNIEDIDYFVQRWLLGDCASSNNCDGTDMNTDGTVNFIDFALFAQNWLQQD